MNACLRWKAMYVLVRCTVMSVPKPKIASETLRYDNRHIGISREDRDDLDDLGNVPYCYLEHFLLLICEGL